MAMKVVVVLVLFILASTECSLLEMSQNLWTKLVTGGLAHIGRLDPLRVPMIKVDQSQGDTSYRMILKNVEIVGLNNSTLESIHIARGRLKSNLSELEAGYVSYSDLRDIDSIRYRFHTLVKEPRGQNESFEAIVSSKSLETRLKSDSPASRFVIDQFDNMKKEEKSAKLEISDEYQSSSTVSSTEKKTEQEFSQGEHRISASAGTTPKYHRHQYYANTPFYYHYADTTRNQGRQQYQYAGSNSNYKSEEARSQSGENQRYFVDSSNYKNEEEKSQGNRQDPRYFATTSRYRSDEERKIVDEVVRQSPQLHLVYAQSVKDAAESASSRQENVDVVDCKGRQVGGKAQDAEGSASEIRESKVLNPNQGAQMATTRAPLRSSTSNKSLNVNEKNSNSSKIRLEKQPGYIDIVYADQQNETMKRFGNMKLKPDEDARVFRLVDFMKNIRKMSRIFKYNLTDGESLTKRNNTVKIALEGKILNDTVRYAPNYQEKQGYFEEGMQIMYHYGMGENESAGGSRNMSSKRSKRADIVEDDVMHVIVRIHVPLLNIKTQYMLAGKVGQEILRGNGQLTGNFTELIADFTVELKKVNDTSMIVQAARAKLTAKDKKINLQGMDEKGPVQSVLTHGLMAAEAVAAMLADDLATKALNDKTADAIIYRMYKDLPPT